MIKNWLLISFVLLLNIASTNGQTLKTKVIANKRIKYKFINESAETFFVASEYHMGDKNGDSIIFESYPKSKIIKYYQFNHPMLKSVKRGDSTSGTVSVFYRINKNVELFFRVFNEDIETYKSKMKIDDITEGEYIRFENTHSYLVKVELP